VESGRRSSQRRQSPMVKGSSRWGHIADSFRPGCPSRLHLASNGLIPRVGEEAAAFITNVTDPYVCN